MQNVTSTSNLSLNRASSQGRHRPVTVVGAGFSGLVSAFYLSRAGFEVEVIEKSDRVGGLIGTIKAPFGLVETAANAMLCSARIEELFGLLGLELKKTQKIARNRYIFRNGFPRRWPIGFLATARVALFALSFIFFKNRVRPKPFESIRTYGKRVLGGEASQYLLEAALQGIYAGDPVRLSANLILSGVFADRSKKPRPGKVHGSVSAPEGMGQLVQRLYEKLSDFGVRFRFEQDFASLTSVPDHPILLATPAWTAAELLRGIDSVRADALASIESLPVVTATIAFKEAPPKARGFGCLFPPVESRKAMGVLMNNYIFAGRTTRGFSENWIFGGARASAKELLAMSDDEIVNMAIDERNVVLSAGGEYHSYRITRWPKALPHYTADLERALPELRGLRQNVLLIGNYVQGIGLAKILEAAASLPDELLQKGEWKQ